MITLHLIRELGRVAERDARDHLSRGESDRGVDLLEHRSALLDAYYDADVPTDAEIEDGEEDSHPRYSAADAAEQTGVFS